VAPVNRIKTILQNIVRDRNIKIKNHCSTRREQVIVYKLHLEMHPIPSSGDHTSVTLCTKT
jgi:hypothetical protein